MLRCPFIKTAAARDKEFKDIYLEAFKDSDDVRSLRRKYVFMLVANVELD